MNASLWLAWAELRARRRQFAAGAALVAAAVALFSATDLVARAREAAVAAQIDYLGPSLRLVPAGVTSTDLARFELGDTVIPERTVSALRRELSLRSGAAEGRLLLREAVDTVRSPIIGMAPDGGVGSLAGVRDLASSDVLLGAELARRLGRTAGERVSFLGRTWRVHGVLPPLGSAEDLAVVARLPALQVARGLATSVNEIRLYVEPGAPTDELAARLRQAHPELSVVTGAERGSDAERQTATTLRLHRNAAFWLTALAVVIGLTIAAHLNAAERRVEMAMVVVMGGTATSVLATFVARAIIISLVGAVAGYTVGAGIAVFQDAGAGLRMAWSWTHPATAIAAAAAVSVAAVVPVSVYASYRDHARSLQE